MLVTGTALRIKKMMRIKKLMSFISWTTLSARVCLSLKRLGVFCLGLCCLYRLYETNLLTFLVSFSIATAIAGMDFYPSSYANYQVNKQNGNSQNSNNWENNIYYVGPYCKDASLIYLGTFLDNKCTYAATHATFASSYQGSSSGSTFPYFKEAIVSSGECISCQNELQVFQDDSGAQMQQNYNSNESANYEEEAGFNQLCGYLKAEGNDNVISCVYKKNGGRGGDDDGLYDGCGFFDMLPKLDGRNSKTIEAANNSLNLQNRYSVILAALAVVLILTVAFLTMCNPNSIDERKQYLLNDTDNPVAGTSAPRTTPNQNGVIT